MIRSFRDTEREAIFRQQFSKKADAVLVVDANAVLSFAVSGERFQAVAGNQGQVLQRNRPIQLEENAQEQTEPACSWRPLDRVSVVQGSAHGAQDGIT